MRHAAMLDCDCGISKEGVETASCAGDFVKCDVSRFGGGIMIKEDEDAGEDVEVEADRYPGHGNLQSRICLQRARGLVH